MPAGEFPAAKGGHVLFSRGRARKGNQRIAMHAAGVGLWSLPKCVRADICFSELLSLRPCPCKTPCHALRA